ncbi:hypothetical protein EDB92DRAFT_1868485 [Lactarius akahatsu]|uniref:Secreted protein n=1 Tax=Lactarius akahatsu TaxID=416441 RepID=A0AAD4LF99_9AGAM|nr:hypothetical protein EDB92DRAFT_1868485 [Lactarius akahatsu]
MTKALAMRSLAACYVQACVTFCTVIHSKVAHRIIMCIVEINLLHVRVREVCNRITFDRVSPPSHKLPPCDPSLSQGTCQR